MLNLKDDKKIEEAIMMLVNCVCQKCTNSKPLILHSLRVGFEILELGEAKEVVMAGVLHDLLEDTDCKIGEIKEKFGLKVARLVWALTQEDIKDYKERWRVLFLKIKKIGREAMIIKLADASDNLNYVYLVKDEEMRKRVFWKHSLIIKELKLEFGGLEFFREYRKKHRDLRKKYL